MKIQCSCGAKYEFEIAPGMQPLKFVCQSCGRDYSDFVNELIRKELAAQQISNVATSPTQSTAPTAPAEPEIPRLKISRAHDIAPPTETAPESKYCPRHHDRLATDRCHVCKKPICPKCLDQFGFYCSPFCKNKAESRNRIAPVYAGQKFITERKFWRKSGLISGVIAAVIFSALGFWFWYVWIGSVPRAIFSVRFDDISHSGNSWLVAPDDIVFLHGGTLARYNLKTKEKIWSLELVTKQQIADALKREDEAAAAEEQRTGRSETRLVGPMRDKYARIGLEQELSLRGAGKNVWIQSGDALTHYDWETGKILQQETLPNNFGELAERDGEFLAPGIANDGAQTVTRVNIATGEMQTQEFGGSNGVVVAQNSPREVSPNAQTGGGLPLSPNAPAQPLNPQRVEQQAQNLSLPARIALPALIANNRHNQQIEQEIQSEDHPNQNRAPQNQSQQPLERFENVTLISDGDSFVEFDSRMVQQNFVQREAVRAPPAKSALDSGNLGAMNESGAVNEQLNEMQRNNGGDKATENESRYKVSIRRADSAQIDWSGEVIGPPQFFPLKTVNVLAAGKTIIVFDKSNKKLWQADFIYDVTGGDGQLFQSQFGAGPCAENGGTVYVFDQAVLTAFDATSGNARWRIPSVGVVGLFFDNDGMVYVNTTTGNPDDIKYSRQIDVTKETEAVVLKVNPADGKILWRAKGEGFISYLSGKFIYAVQSFDPGDSEDTLNDSLVGLQTAYLRIKRINPQNGREMWDHEEARAPAAIRFDGNAIEIVLKKEVEVLRFFSL